MSQQENSQREIIKAVVKDLEAAKKELIEKGYKVGDIHFYEINGKPINIIV